MPDTTVTTRKGRKYDEVLEGAKAVFLRDGFDGASVDDIAREAGVSKATLYVTAQVPIEIIFLPQETQCDSLRL